jgi:hypothetical protein
LIAIKLIDRSFKQFASLNYYHADNERAALILSLRRGRRRRIIFLCSNYQWGCDMKSDHRLKQDVMDELAWEASVNDTEIPEVMFYFLSLLSLGCIALYWFGYRTITRDRMMRAQVPQLP